MSKRKQKHASQRPHHSNGSKGANGHRQNGGGSHGLPVEKGAAAESRAATTAPQPITRPQHLASPVTAPHVAVPQANLRVGTLIIEPEPLPAPAEAGVPDTAVLPLVSPPQNSKGVANGNGHSNGNGTLTAPLDILFPGTPPDSNGVNHEI